jgi:hypothetical protein
MNVSFPFFSLNGKSIHQIHELSISKNYPIKIGTKIFYYSLEELIFLSINAFDHFESNSSQFEVLIEEDINLNHISIENLESSFILIDSLFHSQTQIEINETNVLSLSLLSEILDNPYLHSKCEKYSK